MSNYQVQLIFNDGIYQYTFPLLQSVSDPVPGIKGNTIEGKRADGSIFIPGGKKSANIVIKGVLLDNDGYEGLTEKINEMREKVTTSIATLTLKHYTGSTWQTDWAFTVRRIDEIDFPESEDKRTSSQEYEIKFLILSY